MTLRKILLGGTLLAAIGCSESVNSEKDTSQNPFLVEPQTLVPANNFAKGKVVTYAISIPNIRGNVPVIPSLGDIDNDGDLDLVLTYISSSDFDGKVTIFKNDGKGNFYQDSN
jgi:hypothetical protein